MAYKNRPSLGAKFREILESDNVYFQPPESTKMQYPAIVYSLSRIERTNADNNVYQMHKAYDVTLIHPDPDNTIKEELASLPMCRFDRHFKADNLNHYTYTIYY